MNLEPLPTYGGDQIVAAAVVGLATILLMVITYWIITKKVVLISRSAVAGLIAFGGIAFIATWGMGNFQVDRDKADVAAANIEKHYSGVVVEDITFDRTLESGKAVFTALVTETASQSSVRTDVLVSPDGTPALISSN